MLTAPTSRKNRPMILLLYALAGLQFMGLMTGVTILLSAGGGLGLPAGVAIMTLASALVGIALALFAAKAIRLKKDWGNILALVLALVNLPSLAFPISLAIFWCLLPDEMTDSIVVQLKELLSPAPKHEASLDSDSHRK